MVVRAYLSKEEEPKDVQSELLSRHILKLCVMS
jgi:hypothetical protein